MLDYNSHLEKRKLQRATFPMIRKNKIVALAGPNICSYIEMLPLHVREISIWEKDRPTMLTQLMELTDSRSKLSFTYNFGDILKAPVEENSFYDLDFCASILTVRDHIKKFKDCQFSVTVSIRPVGKQESLNMFFEIIGEKISYNIIGAESGFVTTSGNNQYFYSFYMDSSPMLNIFKS